MLPQSSASVPTSDPAAPPDDPATSGYTICINVQADGTFTVVQEPLEANEPEEPGEPAEQESSSEPISSFEDALRAALKIYRANPIENDEMRQMEAGYAGGERS